MSTRFYQAINTNPKIGATKFYDTESPEEFFRVILTADPNMDNWNIYLLNYLGDILKTNIDWKNIPLRITAGDLLSYMNLAK